MTGTKKIKTEKKGKRTKIICGTPETIQEASRELEHDMHVVWTSAGFWALPRK